MLDKAPCRANTAKWHLDQSWLKAGKKDFCLHPSTYTSLFIQASCQGLSLKCRQATLNILQQSAGDPILVRLKSKLELRITYTVLEVLIMGHMRCNSIAMAKIESLQATWYAIHLC